MRPLPTPASSKSEKEKLELKMSHANQVLACTALPTLGRNQSMFDTKHRAADMADLDLDNSFGDLNLGGLMGDDDEEGEDSQQFQHMTILTNVSERSSSHMVSTNSTHSEASSSKASSSMLDVSNRSTQSHEEGMDDSCSGRNSLTDFLQARVSTFAKNMDTIAEIVSERLDAGRDADHDNRR